MTDEWSPRPMPRVTPEAREYWAAASEGRLLLQECADCEFVFHYPRAVCPECFSADLDAVESEGEGEIFTFSVVRAISEHDWPPEDVPFAVGYVELDDGPRVMTAFVDCDPETLAIGDRVEARFRDTGDDEVGIPVFAPVE